MAVAKVIELTSASKKSFEDAIQVGIARASKTIKGIESVWIQEQKVTIKANKISEYRVNMKVTFILS
jgi:flavin-binding protein dodecin